MTRKRIYNPRTGKFHKLQQRDGKRKRGQIAGVVPANRPVTKPRKKSLWDRIFK